MTHSSKPTSSCMLRALIELSCIVTGLGVTKRVTNTNPVGDSGPARTSAGPQAAPRSKWPVGCWARSEGWRAVVFRVLGGCRQRGCRSSAEAQVGCEAGVRPAGVRSPQLAEDLAQCGELSWRRVSACWIILSARATLGVCCTAGLRSAERCKSGSAAGVHRSVVELDFDAAPNFGRVGMPGREVARWYCGSRVVILTQTRCAVSAARILAGCGGGCVGGGE